MKQEHSRKQPSADKPTVSDTTLRSFVGYRMKRAFNVVQDDLTATLRPFDLRMLTYTALVLIVDNPGLRQSQLADAMDIERPNLVVIIDELERRELIVRDRVPTDRAPMLSGRRWSVGNFMTRPSPPSPPTRSNCWPGWMTPPSQPFWTPSG